jgi:hypothetical protein
MMNRASRSILVGAALAMVLAGCQRSDAPGITQVSQGDPSVPDAATTFAKQDAADKTKAMQDTTALRRNAAPQQEMTKAQESKAMPLPGQANDDSNLAGDKNKGG